MSLYGKEINLLKGYINFGKDENGQDIIVDIAAIPEDVKDDSANLSDGIKNIFYNLLDGASQILKNVEYIDNDGNGNQVLRLHWNILGEEDTTTDIILNELINETEINSIIADVSTRLDNLAFEVTSNKQAQAIIDYNQNLQIEQAQSRITNLEQVQVVKDGGIVKISWKKDNLKEEEN